MNSKTALRMKQRENVAPDQSNTENTMNGGLEAAGLTRDTAVKRIKTAAPGTWQKFSVSSSTYPADSRLLKLSATNKNRQLRFSVYWSL